jgi:hypothetical protein
MINISVAMPRLKRRLLFRFLFTDLLWSPLVNRHVSGGVVRRQATWFREPSMMEP